MVAQGFLVPILGTCDPVTVPLLMVCFLLDTPSCPRHNPPNLPPVSRLYFGLRVSTLGRASGGVRCNICPAGPCNASTRNVTSAATGCASKRPRRMTAPPAEPGSATCRRLWLPSACGRAHSRLTARAAARARRRLRHLSLTFQALANLSLPMINPSRFWGLLLSGQKKGGRWGDRPRGGGHGGEKSMTNYSVFFCLDRTATGLDWPTRLAANSAAQSANPTTTTISISSSARRPIFGPARCPPVQSARGCLPGR